MWESFFFDPRYKPSFTQQRMVEAGWLGRKTRARVLPVRCEGSRDQPQAAVQQGRYSSMDDICWRVLVMLINEAADALHLGIASRDDIDLAMTKGVNYPKGLLKWADEKGIDHCLCDPRTSAGRVWRGSLPAFTPAAPDGARGPDGSIEHCSLSLRSWPVRTSWVVLCSSFEQPKPDRP